MPLLHQLLTHDTTNHEGRYYTAHDARMTGGCVQKPRIPFVIAAMGQRGMALAVRYGQGWVTCPFLDNTHASNDVPTLIHSQVTMLTEACQQQDRDPASLDKVYLTGFTPENPLSSVDTYRRLAEQYADIGITEIIIHWPVPRTGFDNDMATFEKIANTRWR